MKFNWGTGIALVIIVFLIAVISFVLFTTTIPIDLVEEDYYPRELNYQEQITMQANTDALEEKLTFEKTDSLLLVSFPDFFRGKVVSGTILVYRPSDHTQDKLYPIELDSNNFFYIPAFRLLPGKYILKANWTCEGIPYYQENVFIN